MIIHAFDRASGTYAFEVEGLSAERHRHPAVERITALHGSFEVRTASGNLADLTHYLVPPGQWHAVVAPATRLRIELYGLGTAGAARLGFGPPEDPRIASTLDYLRTLDGASAPDLAALAERVHLSPSRLSHLFRAHTETTVARALAFARLTAAIAHHLRTGDTLAASALAGGFHDPAHLSRRFRDFFGVAPSWAYNSRSVQG